METHKNLLDNMEHWLQQDASLLAMTNEVDYDQDGEDRTILIQLVFPKKNGCPQPSNKGSSLWNTVCRIQLDIRLSKLIKV